MKRKRRRQVVKEIEVGQVKRGNRIEHKGQRLRVDAAEPAPKGRVRLREVPTGGRRRPREMVLTPGTWVGVVR